MEIGGEEYFEKGICIIEWGEMISDILPKEYIHIIFDKEVTDENIRKLKITSYGNKLDCYLENLERILS